VSPNWVPSWIKQKSESGTEGTPVQEKESPGASTAQGDGLMSAPITEEVLMEALKEVYDPELAISIVDLGLVYGVETRDKRVVVRMTLTSPGCPLGPTIQAMVNSAIAGIYPEVEDIRVDFVWNPPWDPYTMATEEGKDLLGIW